MNDKKYSKKTLELLTGSKSVDIENVPEDVLTIAEAVEDPDNLPYIIEDIINLKITDKEKFRYVLLRVQIDSHLHMNEDLEKYQKRVFVAQVIEKLLYGDLMLEAGNDNDEEDDD